MRKIAEGEMEKFGTLNGREKTIAVLGDRWWPQTAKQEGDKVRKTFYAIHGKNVMSAQILEMSPSGLGTVVRLERDAWSMVIRLRPCMTMSTPPPPRAGKMPFATCENPSQSRKKDDLPSSILSRVLHPIFFEVRTKNACAICV